MFEIIFGDQFLDNAWVSFGRILGPLNHFWIKSGTLFWKAREGSREPSWEPSALSWASLGRQGVAKTPAKNNTGSMILKLLVFAILVLLERFWRPF